MARREGDTLVHLTSGLWPVSLRYKTQSALISSVCVLEETIVAELDKQLFSVSMYYDAAEKFICDRQYN